MKQKIFAMLLALLVMAVSVPALAAESDNNGSNYQQSDDGCKDGVCPWRKGGK